MFTGTAKITIYAFFYYIVGMKNIHTGGCYVIRVKKIPRVKTYE